MFQSLGRLFNVIVVLYILFSGIVTCEYEPTLYVASDPSSSHKITVINRNNEITGDVNERFKRDASLNSPPSAKNISTWVKCDFLI